MSEKKIVPYACSSLWVRNETPQDYRLVEEITREAFWNLYMPGCEEHFLAHQLRSSSDFIKELSFVIEVEGKVQGAIFYTHSKIVSEDGSEFKTITFGPVCIAPEFHRQGLGRKLIGHSIAAAKEMGFAAITTLGYPYHYQPYGFLGGKKYGISMEDGKFYQGLLVLPLYEGALSGISGKAVFSESFVCDPKQVEAFDLSFPPKEKKVQPSQKEFETACAALDE